MDGGAAQLDAIDVGPCLDVARRQHQFQRLDDGRKLAIGPKNSVNFCFHEQETPFSTPHRNTSHLNVSVSGPLCRNSNDR